LGFDNRLLAKQKLSSYRRVSIIFRTSFFNSRSGTAVIKRWQISIFRACVFKITPRRTEITRSSRTVNNTKTAEHVGIFLAA